MTWARFDDKTWRNRKVRRLSDAAHRIWTDSIIYSCEHLTDGQIEPADFEEIALSRHKKAKIAAELEAAGLWTPAGDGWVINDFGEFNPSRAQVVAKRERDAARQALKRERDRVAAEREASGMRAELEQLRASRDESQAVSRRDAERESQEVSRSASQRCQPHPSRPVIGNSSTVQNTRVVGDRVSHDNSEQLVSDAWAIGDTA